MLRRAVSRVLTIASVLFPLSVAAAQPAARASDRPNVVLILMDDLGYGDVAADPGERHDLTAAHTEIVRELSAALDKWEKDVATQNVIARDVTR